VRRRLFRIALAVTAVVVVLAGAGGIAVAVLYSRADLDTTGEVDFTRPLRIPPLAPSKVDADGRRVFDLTARRGRTEFQPGVVTDTYGIDGSYLGPTLRARRGERVVVGVENAIGEPTTMHWHGMHLPARMDGGPHQVIEPGATWSPTWEIDQPAATLWYHPHLDGETAEHVYRGLAGMFIVDDPAASAPGLPSRYGVDDVPVVVQDRRFHDDGRLDLGEGLFSPTGILGDEILVNGTLGPYLDVRSERVRLRLLNASNGRVYDFGFSDERAFALVGSDGGLLERPHRIRRVMLSPGERAEIVVALRPGERTVLRSTPPDLGTGGFDDRFAGGDDRLDILELRAADRLRPAPPVPDALADLPRLDEADAVRTREFELRGRTINGERMDMDRIDETVAAGSTEIWEVVNTSGTPHSFHVHDVRFRILAVDGSPPTAALAGWKDTVYLPPNRTFRLIVPFGHYADPHTPYMLHCHVLRHEDQGMMGQFAVTADGSHASGH
jgi:blue copper oxidase